MKIIKLAVGNLGTNCYIAYCETSKKAVIIDPGGNAKEILDIVKNEKLEVEYIINTHGHVDHITANASVKAATGVPLLIHKDDAPMLLDATKNLSAFMGQAITSPAADRLLEHGDKITVGTMEFEVMHTPGHTPGGICLKCDVFVFSGDTLFSESIGRTDFPGGSSRQLIQSVKEQLMVLPDVTAVYPGHGPDTTIGWERKYNPFIM